MLILKKKKKKVIDFVFFSDPIVAGCFQVSLTKRIIKLSIFVGIRNEWGCSQPKVCEVFKGHVGKD